MLFIMSSRFKGHLATHGEVLDEPGKTAVTGNPCPEARPCKQDDLMQLQSSFAFCALLLLDTYDAYRQCDGDRIFRNAKFEWLLCDATNRVKYRLNLWRMLAYETAILSPQQAYEYKWNCSVNLQGGAGNNIANDNMVELHVDIIKRRLRAQGANMTFSSAQMASDTIQVQQDMRSQIQTESKARKASAKRTVVTKTKDVQVMAQQILDAGYLEHHCNRQSKNFKNFQHPLKRVDVSKLCEWLKRQKERAAVEMVHIAKC